MNFNIGEMNTLIVDRKTDIGYMLKNEYDEEVFIHNNQLKGNINEGEKIEVFIYFDGEKRLTATREIPFITVNKPGFVKVKSVLFDLGVFIDNNIVKDPLISIDDLPLDENKWPHIGDTVFCKLKNTKTQLIAKLVTPEELKDILIPEKKLYLKDKALAYVTKSGEQGINLITKEGHSIFVYYKNKRKDYHIGEEVLTTIINTKEDNTYNGTLLENKELLISSDSKIIIDYLKNNNNYMEFTSKSNLKDIEEVFKMSKLAFKRALGHLYKEKIIEIKEDGTYLIK